MRKQGNIFQLKEQSKIPEDRVLSDMEMENPPEKKFRVMIIKMIKGFRKRMKAQSKKWEVFNKELENIKNDQRELKNNWNEKYARRNQQQTKWGRTYQWAGRYSSVEIIAVEQRK